MMMSVRNNCPECGMPLLSGIANCSSCGAQVGTVFSEADLVPQLKPASRRKKPNPDAVQYESIESAKDRANSALIFSLASFLPFVSYTINGLVPFFGSILAVASIIYGLMGLRVLIKHNIEEGKGAGIAGIIIGIIAIIAQVAYLLYFLKVVSWNPVV